MGAAFVFGARAVSPRIRNGSTFQSGGYSSLWKSPWRKGTQWVVFLPPNDEPLWARVEQSVENFLSRLWRDGALQGAKPELAYFVRVDRTTMTQDDIDNGRLIMIIGVAPVKPAEFVIIRIGQWHGGSEVTEL